jgi:monoamine oxidase
MLKTSLGGEFMSDPSEVSLLHALFFIHSFQSMDWILSAHGGAQQDLVVGGMQGIADRLAARLGSAMHLNVPVRRVTQDADRAEVTGDSVAVKARRVIMAIPPILAGRIDYSPSLPPLKSQLLDRSPAGQGIKAHAIYPEPFWRADGLSGQGADLDSAPSLSLDVTPPTGKPGVLQAFAAGPDARRLAALAPEERRKVFLGGLVKRFGPKAANPFYYNEHDWAADEWSRGDMFAHYAPGVLTNFGKALRAPCGRIHWAGTETATQWAGCIEGAVRAGERAAEEVLNAS